MCGTIDRSLIGTMVDWRAMVSNSGKICANTTLAKDWKKKHIVPGPGRRLHTGTGSTYDTKSV